MTRMAAMHTAVMLIVVIIVMLVLSLGFLLSSSSGSLSTTSGSGFINVSLNGGIITEILSCEGLLLLVGLLLLHAPLNLLINHSVPSAAIMYQFSTYTINIVKVRIGNSSSIVNCNIIHTPRILDPLKQEFILLFDRRTIKREDVSTGVINDSDGV